MTGNHFPSGFVTESAMEQLKYFVIRVIRPGLLVFLFMSLQMNGSPQTSITLSFTASFEGIHKSLDSIKIVNVTRGGDTTLYGIDTMLYLGPGITVQEDGFQHSEGMSDVTVYPNPSMSYAFLQFSLLSEDKVIIRVLDLQGKEQIKLLRELPAGKHLFSLSPGTSGIFLISAETRTQRVVSKFIHYGNDAESRHMDYLGSKIENMRTEKTASGFDWMPGDQVRYTGFGPLDSFIFGHDILEDTLVHSDTCTFYLRHGIPCIDAPFINDVDGNIYRTVQIGNQCWLRENLRTTRYINGTSIPLVTGNTSWINLTSPGYCWYDNDSMTYSNRYGALYNWFAVSQNNLCPVGWHLPSDAEWQVLEMHLGMSPADASQTGFRGTIEGGSLKDAGTVYWDNPNLGATNASGFTALPSGKRSDGGGEFSGAGCFGYWWTSSTYNTIYIWYRILSCNEAGISRMYHHMQHGYSVRCIRD